MLDQSQKNMLVSSGVSSFADEYFMEHGKHAEASELSDFYRSHSDKERLEIIRNRNFQQAALDGMLHKYPRFWDDLHAAIEQVKIPASRRPTRTFT